MTPFTPFTSRVAFLPDENIDTDQILPARFLKTISKVGLGQQLFADWRYADDGSPLPDFVLNKPETQGAQILLTGDNFGCGSSREHAPWALHDWGFRAVISTSFADIFNNNALKNGLLPLVVDNAVYQELTRLALTDPEMQVTVDLAAQTLTLPNGRAVIFPIDSFSKTCLLEGLDQLGYLLKRLPEIEAYERRKN
jgi:3-isopropylmalate/(R)-2-methylmalate dehydratase small subunit